MNEPTQHQEPDAGDSPDAKRDAYSAYLAAQKEEEEWLARMRAAKDKAKQEKQD